MNSTNSLKRYHGATAPEEQLLLHERHKNSVTLAPSKPNSRFSEKKYVEPVRLTPAWEEKNLPNDVLNFKSVTMEQAELETNPPKDRLLIVYFIMLIHGIGILMPWNMFITAKDYFEEYKLSQNYTGTNTTFYRENFMLYMTVCSQVPNVVFAWLNIFVNLGGTLTSRIVYSIIIEVIIFIFTEIMVLVDTSGIPLIFFIVTLVSVFLLNVVNGIYQNTIYGLAARLPAAYTGAVILGNNISGIFSSLINILTKVISPVPKIAAVYYFVVALLVLFICFDTYFVLPLTNFYKFHDLQFKKAERKTLTNAEGKNVKHSTPYWEIFKQCSGQCFNAFFIFFITLSIFPSLHSNVQKHNDSFFIDKSFFASVTCFLTFNVFACIGNLLSTLITWPGPNKLWVPIILRTIFIPLFLLCNFQPLDGGRIMPIYIYNEWVYWGIAVLFAFTSGYFSSLAMMYCGKTVAPEHSSIAGMFGAACLVTGIVCGVCTALIFPIIVKNITW